MEIAASCNPVTYVMEALRALVLGDWSAPILLRGFGIALALGALMLVLNLRLIRRYE